MRVKVMSFVVDAFETLPKKPEKSLKELEIRGRVETIHMKTLLRFG